MDESGAINHYFSRLWIVACAEIGGYLHGGDGFDGKDALRFLVKSVITGFSLEHREVFAFE
jgi:hypothetical protein